MTFDNWLLFLALWTAASLPLGPNALNCIALSAQTGFRRSLWAIAGILIASAGHMTATLLGVAALLAANAILFQAVKFAGAAYLVWMGLSLWCRGGRIDFDRREDAETPGAIVRRAVLISLSNPKAVFAYLAVFAQFVEPGGDLAARLAVLVPTSFGVTVVVYGGYCLLGLGVAQLLSSARRQRWFNRTVAAFCIAAGAGLVLSEGRRG